MMKCKEARTLALKWYKTLDEMDKVAYLEHRRTCAFCKIEFIRECKRMELNIPDYDDSVFDDEVIG
jgi:hypothetical protein